MKKRLALIIVLCATCVLCALAVMPARWLIAILPSSGLLVAVDASGSIWSGNATLAIGQPPLRRALPEPLHWTLRLAGGPHLSATHPALGGELTLAPSWRGLRISAQTLRLPATILPTLHAALGALNPGGDVTLSWPDTLLSGFWARPAGSPLLDLRWNNASSSLSRVRPMGAYRIALTQGEKGQIDVALSTLVGPLALQGQGTYGADSGLRFEGTARTAPGTTPDTQAALADLLNTLGPAQGDIHPLKVR